MTIHSSKSFEMPLLLSAFSNVLPQVICGQPILDIDSYFHNRILRWAGHVARMPMSRAPRQLLTGWVSQTREGPRGVNYAPRPVDWV